MPRCALGLKRNRLKVLFKNTGAALLFFDSWPFDRFFVCQSVCALERSEVKILVTDFLGNGSFLHKFSALTQDLQLLLFFMSH